MAIDVIVYELPGHNRSRAVCAAMERGIRICGYGVARMSAMHYRQPTARVAVFYGLAGHLLKVFKDYRADPLRRAVYVDLGYWGRRLGGRFSGYHKVSVDARHPTEYFQDVAHGDDRARALGVSVRPWRQSKPTDHILVAGMGPKGAAAEGYAPNAWELEAVRTIRGYSRRRILYRPKPNWAAPVPIPGATMTDARTIPLDRQLDNCHAIVSHHSNANVEALVRGVPSFSIGGVATAMGLSDLSKIESPRCGAGREQWIADIAYTQWSIAEMAAGDAWNYLVKEALV